MRQQVGGVGHRPGQHLLQVAHCGEQTPRVCEVPAPPGVLGKGECQATRLPLVALPWPEEGIDRPGWLLWIGMDSHHPVVARLLKPGTGGGPRECRGWHHPGRVEPSIPKVFQQATWLAHVSWELERAKHALPLDSLKDQELAVHQDSHRGTSRRDGGSVVSVVHKHRRPQAPSFRYVPAFGEEAEVRSASWLASKSMKPFSAQKYGALRQRSTGLSCQ